MKAITNRKAKFDYKIVETYEAGIKLLGFEVKALRAGKANLKGSYVTIRDNVPYLINAHISPYQPANTPTSYEPTHPRQLLLTKDEIKSLIGKLKSPGLTLIPLKLYNKGPKSRIVLEIGLGQGKKKYDKRETIKKRESDREIARSLKN